jgi:hypothetical protein
VGNSSLSLPRAFNAEGAEAGGFGVGEGVLDEVVDAAASGTSAQAGAEFGQVGLFSVGDHFHVAFFGVSDPAAEVELAGLAVDKPAEAYALYAALNQEMKNHCFQTKVSFADWVVERKVLGDPGLKAGASACYFRGMNAPAPSVRAVLRALACGYRLHW